MTNGSQPTVDLTRPVGWAQFDDAAPRDSAQPCHPIHRWRRAVLAGLLAVALTVGPGALAPQGRLTSRADPSPHAVDPCAEDPPVLAVVCNGPMRAYQRTTAVRAVLDRPSAASDYPLATTEQVGAVWALANSWVEPALYVAAYHKRAHRFGPGGPGQIYRVDFRLGAVAPFLVVPGVGKDSHSRDNLSLDEDGRDGAGKRSLGGMALSDDGAELFVVNLYDRQIYRFDRASGRLLGQLAHGAAALPWAADARPFALAFRDGWLYHGVVNSAESSQRAGDLRAHVYASRADGTELREVLELRVDYPRGVARIAGVAGGPPLVDVPLAWQPWKDGYNRAALAQVAIYPQPVLADIAFTATGDMLLGLRDRQSDVALGQQMIQPSGIEKPGLGVGDLLLARRQGDGWAPVLPDGRGGEPFSDVTALADGSVTGGLASLVGLDAVVAGAAAPSALQINVVDQSLTWFRASDGRRLRRHDLACDVFAPPTPVPFARLLPAPPVAHADDEWSPVTDVGDVEALRCRAPATATPTDLPTPTDTVTPSPTSTATATPTATGTMLPSATPTRSAYLPVTLSERCVPGQQHSDVVLVLDASESMLNPTAAGRPKLEAAKDAARAFLRLLDLGADQAALVWFNGQAGTALGLSADLDALVAALETIPVRGGTRIHLGLDEARRLLAGPGRRAANTPVVVLLSDGRSAPDPPALAVAAAGRLKATGVTLFTVGLGADVDAAEMAALATSPEHFRRAADGEDLRSVYQRIARELPCPGERFFPHPPGPPGSAPEPEP